ncbi:MAG: ABC transporter permease subunit [Bacillota bacterium]
MLSVYKRELRTYFYSPLAYVLSGIYMFVFSIFFLNDIMSPQGSTQFLFGARLYFMSFWLVMLIPILTMRIFAEERKSGTEVLLMTSPVNVGGIVIGKYLAALTVFLTMTALTVIYPIVVSFTGNINVITAVSSYIGYILIGASFVAFGLFTSSITENQIIAAVLGTVGLFFILLIDSIKFLFKEILNGLLFQFIERLSLYERFKQFVQGIFNLKDFIFFLSVTGVLIALAMIVIEKRRWSQG